MTGFVTRMDTGGIVSLPPDWLEEHGIEVGDTVRFDIENGNIVIYPPVKPEPLNE